MRCPRNLCASAVRDYAIGIEFWDTLGGIETHFRDNTAPSRYRGFLAFEPACSNTRGLEVNRQACSARLLATAFACADIRHSPIGGISVAPTAMANRARGRLERFTGTRKTVSAGGTEVFPGERFRSTEYVC